MKIIIPIVLFCYISTVHSQATNCDATCSDASNPAICIFHHHSTKNCSDFWARNVFCRRTCKTCKPCLPARDFSNPCETGSCENELSQGHCTVVANIVTNGCQEYGSSCRKTCGLCSKCKIPPPPCITECQNIEDFCDDWEELGYCNESSQYHRYMEENCPLSCGFCKLCPTEAPPNTALPPLPSTEPACLTSGCEDNDTSCSYWAENGFCNETGPFPFTRVICPKSCEICIPCPTMLPPPETTVPVCSEDCNEVDKSCSFWKMEGFCNETSAHYSHMERACPVTCELCNPC